VKIKKNENLAPYTTFKIGGEAEYFCAVKNISDLQEAVLYAEERGLSVLFLGGGSNMLVSDEGFDGLAVAMDTKGIKAEEKGNEIILQVAAGEIWDSVVELAVKKGWWGIENLSHIPGKTGAFAVQNVGAYGQEASHVVDKVTAFDIENHEIVEFSNQDCKFSYRSSVFNSESRGKYAILYTYLKLNKQPRPNLWYRDLNTVFAGKNPSLIDIREAVIKIRDGKFPFPKKSVNGNAGSCFKNIILAQGKFEEAKIIMGQSLGSEAVSRLENRVIVMGDHQKIPAAFLLDVCGLKDLQIGGAAINRNQPLVIINKTGKAKAADVLEVVGKVLATVKEKTGLTLEIEPELIGFKLAELERYGIVKKV